VAGATSSADGGGGGGSVGIARFNTSTGTVNQINGASVRSFASIGSLMTRQTP